jgi:NADP-dependent 3-hydroxy acid dehydrogenase YdfG
VRAFADDWEGPIDALINNAGVMAVPEQRTADGFEMQDRHEPSRATSR